jgi:hypothetical protein
MDQEGRLSTITAEEMARDAGIDAKLFRSELRKADFSWHQHNERWEVLRGSPEHQAMKAVLGEILRRRAEI